MTEPPRDTNPDDPSLGEDEILRPLGESNPWVDLTALPVAAFLAWVFTGTFMPGTFLWLFFQMPMHEVGHSLVGWLSSRFYVPLPCISFGDRDQTWSVFVFWFLIMGMLAAVGWTRRRPFLPAFAAGFPALQLVCTLMVPAQRTEMWIIYSGIGGEMVLGTLLIVAFHYRLPASWRWDFWRFPAMFGGMCSYVAAAKMWLEIRWGSRPLPMGSFFGSSDDKDGDINRLADQFGWGRGELIGSYLYTAKICLLVIAGHYLYFLVAGIRGFLAGRYADLNTPPPAAKPPAHRDWFGPQWPPKGE